MAIQKKNECANNFQFKSLPFYTHLSFLLQQKLYQVITNHCHQLIYQRVDVVTITMTTASISLVQLGINLAYTSMGTLLATVTLA